MRVCRAAGRRCWHTHTASPARPSSAARSLAQVAGLKYRVAATVNGSTDVVIAAFKPLPHTGAPLEVQGVEAGGAL